MRLRKRLPSDQSQVLQLLISAGLPPDGLEHTEGWVLEAAGTILGHIAGEPASGALVLRSLAVAADHRGQGLAAQLLTAAEATAAGRVLVLKTDNLGPWLERRGFARVSPDQVPQSIRTTTQFAGPLCAGTPVYLKESGMNPEAIDAAVRERRHGFGNNQTSCCGLDQGRQAFKH